MTDWRIDWRYRVGGTPGVDGCSCTSFTTQVSIVTTLPRWQPTPEAAPEVVADWNRFIRALGEHEHGHARLALAALADVRHRVKNMGTDPDCRALGRRIEEVVNRAIAEHRARDRDYDVRTRHGANQGAALSPPGRGTGR
jgi:predicted secreted Zn-dependent protease